MLMPDVTAIIDDPELGGGQEFTLIRTENTRTLGSVTVKREEIPLTGNVQPQALSSQSSTVEDLRNESIVIYAKYGFTCGKNDGGTVFYGADEILYDEKRYRVTSVNDWSKWGFSIAYAMRVLDSEEE